ncbi:MAG: PAS domain S-box protein [Syntrophales bacterium]
MTAPEYTHKGHNGRRLRILILEDAETDAELMEDELLRAGVSFLSFRAETREAFCRLIRDVKPDLILADYSLPVFDGRSALAIANEKCPDVPFIFVSGAMGEELAIELLKEGATDYVLKDRLSKLPAAVLRALREAEERTERKAAEKKLRDSEEKYRSLVESTGDSIYMLDAAGRYLFANGQYLSRRGLLLAELIGRSYGDLHTLDEEKELNEKIKLVLETGETIQYENREPEGNRFFLKSLSPVRNLETGKPFCVTVISKDITKRRRAEEELKKAHLELELRVRDRTAELASSNEKLKKEIEERILAEEALQGAHREMEKRVEERTMELAEYNRILQTEIAERKRAEIVLQQYHKRLRSLTFELTLAEERERRRIATELHERLAQVLAMSKLKIGLLRQSSTPKEWESPLTEILHLIDEAIRDTRSLTLELSSPVLDQFGFVAAMEWLTEKMQERYGIPISLEADGDMEVPDHDFQVLLYRSTRELIMNSIKHARAKRIKVVLKNEDPLIRIEVQDDGVGFDTIFMDWTNGFGLFSIRERLRHIGGRFHIESGAGKGTRVTMLAPKKKSSLRRRFSDKLLPFTG